MTPEQRRKAIVASRLGGQANARRVQVLKVAVREAAEALDRAREALAYATSGGVW